MWSLLVLCSVLATHRVQETTAWTTPPETTAWTAPPETTPEPEYTATTAPPETTATTAPPETTATTAPPETTGHRSCRYNCGYDLGVCSCRSSCNYYGTCCYDYNNYCLGTTAPPETTATTAPPDTTGHRSCRYNCGYDLGVCSCRSSCNYYGTCCYDYNNYCLGTTTAPTDTTTAPETTMATAPPDTTGHRSCRYNCGYDLGVCSCRSSCNYYGTCCYDYNNYCPGTTTAPPYTTAPPETTQTTEPPETTGHRSCRYNCGYDLGVCSCRSSCNYYGTCCYDYNNYCLGTTTAPTDTTTAPETTMATAPPDTTGHRSCRYNCGYDLGVCSCRSSCNYYGTCCYDYNNYCPGTTTAPAETTTATAPPTTTGHRSCRYNCGYDLGVCSCRSSCRYNGNCCNDYNYYCPATTAPPTTTGHRSCRYNCGYDLGVCSCRSSCRYNGNCCNDYNYYCPATTAPTTTGHRSCRYNCGYDLGVCSCRSSCRYNGNCCNDYNYYCPATTAPPTTTGHRSCRYNCGYDLGVCSCRSSCRYNGNCCYDYNYYCPVTETTTRPTTQTSEYVTCRNNCGREWAVCSCASSCERYGNCCYDYHSHCSISTTTPVNMSCRYNCGWNMGVCSCANSCVQHGTCCPDYYPVCATPSTTPAPACGGSQYSSGYFTSPNHPHYYQDGANCVWYLKTSHDQRIFLSFLFLELENCCSCDYINIYDGPSLNSRYLGKVCEGSTSSFSSSSNTMTVHFRSDQSVVGRGFKAEFKSILPPHSGRVHCSSYDMEIVIERSYLSSVGYDGKTLYLDDPQCKPTVTWSQVVFRYPLESCGNVRKFQNGSAIYTNAVRAYNSIPTGEITRLSHFKLIVDCRMAKDSVSHNMYLAHSINDSTIIGSGRFNSTMHFYTSDGFHTIVTESPHQVSLNQYLFIEVRLDRFDSALILAFDSCVASPNKDDFHTRPYYLIRNGCEADSTVYIHYKHNPQHYARFRVKAFQFLRASDRVYLQCKVLICDRSDQNSRCRHMCMKRRTRRHLGSEQASQTLILGPIQLKEPEKIEDPVQIKV
uniref:deleted in malignant brain tumors 1 protein isoform X9 n=1 Tax=Solea senegalensis TaxID=28829 RepID=UPI001CD87BB2|nr:deleted in malignant brain tumors 1 protein isoform X9 [Solea senegalensis]